MEAKGKTVMERITKVVAEKLDVEESVVKPESVFIEDLGADSLDLVELIMALEEEFSTPEREVEIPDEAASGIKNPKAVEDYLKEKYGIN